MLFFTVALNYWRVAASLDVWEQSPPPSVRDSLILVVDIVLHLTKVPTIIIIIIIIIMSPPYLLTSSCQQVYTS